jgi:hypothetical protein
MRGFSLADIKTPRRRLTGCERLDVIAMGPGAGRTLGSDR